MCVEDWQTWKQFWKKIKVIATWHCSGNSLFQAFSGELSGERCEVKRSAKKIKPLSPVPPLLFIAIFTSHRSPLSERLEQATVGTAANILSCVCRLTYLLSLLFLFVSISYFISLDPHGKEYQPILKYKELSMSWRVTRSQDWNTRVDSR